MGNKRNFLYFPHGQYPELFRMSRGTLREGLRYVLSWVTIRLSKIASNNVLSFNHFVEKKILYLMKKKIFLI